MTIGFKRLAPPPAPVGFKRLASLSTQRKYAAIYRLRDPRDGMVRYVGKTIDPKRRLSSHISSSYRDCRPSARWCRKLKSLGLRPIMEVVEWTVDWELSERRMIAQYRSEGDRLLNIADGGVDPSHLAEFKAEFSGYRWATRFAGRTKNRGLGDVLRAAWEVASYAGISEMRRLDDMFIQSIRELRPLTIL